MSYDIAVWEGDHPADDEEALRIYDEMWQRYEDTDETPSPRVLEYISDITARYPDLTDLPDDAVDDSPWADGPLSGNVMGPFVYFAMTFEGAEEALPYIAQTARQHGLICFDPQRGTVLP